MRGNKSRFILDHSEEHDSQDSNWEVRRSQCSHTDINETMAVVRRDSGQGVLTKSKI